MALLEDVAIKVCDALVLVFVCCRLFLLYFVLELQN